MRKAPNSADKLDENLSLFLQEVFEVLDQHFENDEIQCHVYLHYPYELIDDVWAVIVPFFDAPFTFERDNKKAILYVTKGLWESQANQVRLREILQGFSKLDIKQFKVESWSQFKAKNPD